MKDLMGLMKQAKEMQSKMQSAQAEVADLEAEGRSGGGMVTVTLTGEGNMKALKIDPSLLNGEEAEIVEDRSWPPFRTPRSAWIRPRLRP